MVTTSAEQWGRLYRAMEEGLVPVLEPQRTVLLIGEPFEAGKTIAAAQIGRQFGVT
jgi:hypothetical protein